MEWNEISSGLIFCPSLHSHPEILFFHAGADGIICMAVVLSEADPGDPEQGNCCRNPDPIRALEKTELTIYLHSMSAKTPKLVSKGQQA